MLLFEKNLLTQVHKILSQKTRVFVVTYSEDFVTLACTVLMYRSKVWRRDGRTPRRWLRCAKHYMLSGF